MKTLIRLLGGAVWSGSALFAQAYLSKNLELIYTSDQRKKTHLIPIFSYSLKDVKNFGKERLFNWPKIKDHYSIDPMIWTSNQRKKQRLIPIFSTFLKEVRNFGQRRLFTVVLILWQNYFLLYPTKWLVFSNHHFDFDWSNN